MLFREESREEEARLLASFPQQRWGLGLGRGGTCWVLRGRGTPPWSEKQDPDRVELRQSGLLIRPLLLLDWFQPFPVRIETYLPPGQPNLLPLVLLSRVLSRANPGPQPDHHRPGLSPFLAFLTFTIAQYPGCCFSRPTHQGKVL